MLGQRTDFVLREGGSHGRILSRRVTRLDLLLIRSLSGCCMKHRLKAEGVMSKSQPSAFKVQGREGEV